MSNKSRNNKKRQQKNAKKRLQKLNKKRLQKLKQIDSTNKLEHFQKYSSSDAEDIRHNRDRNISIKLWQIRNSKKDLTNIDVWQDKDYLLKCLKEAVEETLPIINEYRKVETELYGIEYVEFTESDSPEHESYSTGSIFFDIEEENQEEDEFDVIEEEDEFDVIEVKELFSSEYKRRNENQSYEDIRRENRDRNIACKFWKMRNAKKDLTNVDTWYDKEYLLNCVGEAFEETLPIINEYRKVESELYGIEYVEFTEWDLPEYGTYSDAVFYQAD